VLDGKASRTGDQKAAERSVPAIAQVFELAGLIEERRRLGQRVGAFRPGGLVAADLGGLDAFHPNTTLTPTRRWIEGIQPGYRYVRTISRVRVSGGPMRISDVLRVKGTQVVTVTPDTTVRQLVAVLAEHRIGAVVVSHDGTAVDGIASERDIVQALARRGAAVMSDPVTAIYTAEVHTVTPQFPIEEVMRMMTERRVRHVPVVVDDSLQGLVSIGDVVKIRIGELETERSALTDYITGTR
jgi:CBS domain-containing protein